ncbi:MAG: hypothetical protein WBD25_03945 [Terriglobales bacterium]
MIKKCLFSMALLSLALAVGCAKGGNGEGSGITVSVNNNISIIYPTQPPVTFTATVKGTMNTTVTWSLSGGACTGNGNPCGTIDANSGVYTPPATAPSPATVAITATSAADNTVSGEDVVTIQAVTVVVTPTTVAVGENLVQQFTAVAVPDDAPQTFTWTCTPTGACGSFASNPNNLDIAVYTAPSSTGSVVVSAASTLPPAVAVAGQSKVTVVASRLIANNTYGFQFSGYDSSENPVAVVGTITTTTNGAISTGVEDVLTTAGYRQWTIDSGSYSPSSGNDNSNNLGTLTLNLSNGGTNVTNTYTTVITSGGNFQMIESDSTGVTGSGVMQKAATAQFNSGAQTFAFGFTGVDSNDKRVGYVGMLPMSAGNITGGMFDFNDNGASTGACTSPCSLTSSSSYVQDATFSNLWHMTLSTSNTTQHFDFVLGGGTAQSKTGPNPLTLYAISTDAVDSTHPALSGSMVYQVPMSSPGYNNAAFDGTSVSALTGANANVSLTLGTTDGTSGGTGGAGGFIGNFDQNNNGTIVSLEPTSTPNSQFTYTYVASSGNSGRYIFQMLGNPNASPAVPALPFVLYASGANRGFLLDQSSTAVLTGAMYPQPIKQSGSYAPSEMPGTYAAATMSNSSSSIVPVVQNLLLTSPGNTVYNVAGTQNPHNQALTGTYTLTFPGTGTIALSAGAPATSVIYAIDFDSTNSVITDFMMIGTTSGTSSSIIFAQQ